MLKQMSSAFFAAIGSISKCRDVYKRPSYLIIGLFCDSRCVFTCLKKDAVENSDEVNQNLSGYHHPSRAH